MGDQPQINYGRTKIPGNPFLLRQSVARLQQEIEVLKKKVLDDILHLYIGEVLEIGEEGVEDSSEIPSNPNEVKRKISLKSKYYKVHRFDGTVFEKVFFNGSMSMEDPPVLGSLILFLEIGNDYYVVKTLTTNRRKSPVGIRDENTSFEDIDRNLEPGQVRISETQEGASVFLGNGNIRLTTPSQTNYINLVNDDGTINVAAGNYISSIDELFNLTVTDTSSELFLEKKTEAIDTDAFISIDTNSQIALDNFYNAVRLQINKMELIRKITPASALTMDETGKVSLVSNVTLDTTSGSPVSDSEVSGLILNGSELRLSNLNFELSMDSETSLLGNERSNISSDNFGNLDLHGKTSINILDKVVLKSDNPLIFSNHQTKITVPLLILNNGTLPVARVGDTVTGIITGVVTSGPGAGGAVTGTFTGTIAGPGNESVLA